MRIHLMIDLTAGQTVRPPAHLGDERARSSRYPLRRSRRPGIALFGALSLLVLLGLLIAAGAATTTMAGRSARAVEADVGLSAAADFALNTVFSDPDPDRFAIADSPYGKPTSFDVAVPTAGAQAFVTITRLRDGLVWIVADVWRSAGDRAVRRTSAIARLMSARPLPVAPLVARGVIDVGARVTFGADTAGDADCAALSGVSNTAQASDRAAFHLTPLQLANLDSATRITHARHDTTIGPGAFEGILIADSALTIVGPMTATGLIVASGRIVAASGLSLTGALMSYDSSATPAISVNDASIRYSPCAVAREFRRLFPPRHIKSRSWLELI